MPDMTPTGLDMTMTREELLAARERDARLIRWSDPKGRKYTATPKCMVCGEMHVAVVNLGLWNAYLEGELVQEVFPNLSVAKRDILSGMRSGKYLCPACSPEEDD
jgi:hypothetical protein